MEEKKTTKNVVSTANIWVNFRTRDLQNKQ
jgi:hypothetical protein